MEKDAATDTGESEEKACAIALIHQSIEICERHGWHMPACHLQMASDLLNPEQIMADTIDLLCETLDPLAGISRG